MFKLKNPPPGVRFKLEGETVYMSRDDGKTWQVYMIFPGLEK